ncbi:2-oxoglutarate ferredoxin oxidoreductase subunit alpha [Acidobacteria bacterium Mor1]|nr:2-oxoglutarate ferredoxin oxidoreductase subunit alpha [Acidobacteria bacterium Mor1]
MASQTTQEKGGTTLEQSSVVIRFAGDSGDGMQLTGSQFTATSALAGNDLATFPDFPAEIRAPAGTLPGVSGYQINFSSDQVFTPGDVPDALVAMNPAALKANIDELKPQGILIVNTDAFKANDLRKAGYDENPLENGSLDGYRTVKVELTSLTRKSLAELELPTRTVDRCKNFFALGMVYYLYGRSLEHSLAWIERKFKGKSELVEANRLALKGGYAYCEATEVFHETYEVAPAKLPAGTYRNIAGNQALALGLLAAAEKSGLSLFQGSYPITPASDLLHELSKYKNHGVVTFQAEDEIAAIGAAIGASFAGALGITSTSGPGIALKAEFMSLAISVELPLVVINVMRGGPSTGLPTKTEQSDLLQAMYGRHGETPCIVISASSPADCFETAYEACRLSVEHMTPVIMLSDGFIANGAEPWKLPSTGDMKPFAPNYRTDPEDFLPYKRDEQTLARPWAIPGTPGLEHRIGGLERAENTGNVSYDPENHERMVHIRADKVARVADSLPPAEVDGPAGGKLLVLGWGSTYGSICGAIRAARQEGIEVSRLHLRHLNPFPKNLEEILGSFERVLLPENNMGQLHLLLQGRFLKPIESLTKIKGQPFKKSEILAKIREMA